MELFTPANQPPVFQFESLRIFPELYHAVFTRQGGVSKAPWDSLNIAFGATDADANVRRNRQRLARATGLASHRYLHQVHGHAVHVVDTTNINSAKAPVLQADALITRNRDVGLVIQVADCQAVLLYDPVQKAVANIHAGWRGSVADIIGHTIRTMQRTCRSRPTDLHAAIGPSLGPCCAEFVNYRTEMPEAFWPYADTRRHLDFQQISTHQLQAAGVPRQQIECSRVCTVCTEEWFFSYRRDRVTGRNGIVIGLR